MLKYDYIIKRNENDELVEYKPKKIPKSLPNIVQIEGPNSSGKSTLLNIIAAAFHGYKLNNIDYELRKNIQKLINSDHQELTFDLKITRDDNNILLESSKKGNSRDIKVYEHRNGTKVLLTPETFRKKYNLIYDIPQNPTRRINELIKEIKDLQDRFIKKIHRFRIFLEETIAQISKSRDPKKIDDLEKTIKDYNEELKKNKKEKKGLIKQQEKIEKYTCIKYLQEYTNRCTYLERKIEKLSGKIKYKERTKKSRKTKYSKKIKNIKYKIRMAGEEYRCISSLLKLILPSSEKNHLVIWESISFVDVFKDASFEDDLKIEIRDLTEMLTEMKCNINKNDDLKCADLYQDLIDLLERYKTKDLLIPGVEKNVSEFIDILSEKYEQYHHIKKKAEKIDKVLEKMGVLNDIIADLENEGFPKIKKLRKKAKEEYLEEEYRGYEDDLQELKVRFEKYKKKLDNYDHKFTSLDLDEDTMEETLINLSTDRDISPYTSFTEEEMNEVIHTVKNKVERIEEVINGIEIKTQIMKETLKSLKNKEQHKYINYLPAILKLLKKVRSIERLFKKDFTNYIEEIINDPSNQMDYKNNNKKLRYYTNVFRYLGSKVGRIHHIENSYEVDCINLIEDKIITKEGKIIYLSDMGTGQGQMAYLSGLLNTEDDRKIIALFDEVAAMTGDTLSPIYKILRELYKNGNLLLGVIVLPKNKGLNIVSKME